MANVRKDLGEALVAKGVITPQQLAEAREVQRSAPGDIGRIIVDLGFADEKAVTEVRAETMNLAFVDLATQKIDQSAAMMIPERIARMHKLIPIAKNGTKLYVAMVNPNDPVALQDVKLSSAMQQIVVALATEDDVMDALDRCISPMAANRARL